MVDALRHIEYKENEALSRHCTFRVGGNADLLILPKDKEELLTAINYCKASGMKYMIIGNGSNLLFDDNGYSGAIIKISSNMSEVRIDGEYVYAEAGALLSKIARGVAAAALTGMEFAAGIPGTLGGAVCMNAGAYGGEMKDVVYSVSHITKDGEIGRTDKDDLQFGYRNSVYRTNGCTITGVTVKLAKAPKSEIQDKMDDYLSRRASKQPLEFPSAGSVFKRPEGAFAGALIEQCGLKGRMTGGAQVSEKHAGFIINKSNATAQDVKELIREIQNTVKSETGYDLECELIML